MRHIRHVRNAVCALFPLLFGNFDFFQRNRQLDRLVELIDLFKLLVLSIDKQRKQNAGTDNLAVQMLFLDNRIAGQRIENRMCQSAVVIRCEVLG